MKHKAIAALSLLLVAALSFAAGGTEQKAQTGSAAAVAPSGYTLPLSKGGDTVSVLSDEGYYPTKSLADILPVYQKYVEETGVKIKWEVVKTDYDTVVSTRLAAGADLPDVLRVPGGYPDGWPKFIEGGLFLAMDDLILKYAPNMFKLYWKQRPDITVQARYHDGKLYVLPAVIMGNLKEGENANDVVNPPGPLYRKDVFNELKIAEPTTLAGLHDALVKIKAAKPNLLPVGSFGALLNVRCFAYCYGVPLLMEDFYPNAQGRVEWLWTSSGTKDWVTEMSKWYKEGLIDRDQKPADGVSKVVRGDVVVVAGGAWHGNAFVQHAALKANVPTAYLHLLPPLKVENYKTMYPWSNPWWNGIAVTKNAKNPELVTKWLDYCFYSDRAIADKMYGVLGYDYTIVNGEPKFTDGQVERAKADGNYIYGTGAYSQMMPMIYLTKYRLESYPVFFKDLPEGMASLAKAKDSTNYMLPAFPKMMPAKGETETITQYLSDAKTNATEMITKFITGDQPLSNWDAYVKDSLKYGVDKLVAVKQAQYDRFQKR